MSLRQIFPWLFERIPEWAIKNDLRYFLAFSKLVPDFISNMSPVKGYEFLRKLKPGDFVVDAGSYPGDYAVLASRKIGETGKVICFEPDSKNREVLRKNLEKEKIKNFIIVPKGLWSKNTKLKMKNSDGLHTQLDLEIGDEEIEVAKLDDELEKLNIKKLDVLKMDIEGAEVEAIKGCEKTLKNLKPFVAIASYHELDGKTTSFFIEDFIKKFGYNTKSDYPTHLTTFGWK